MAYAIRAGKFRDRKTSMLVNPLIFLLMQDAPAKPLPALGLISCCGYHPTFTKPSWRPRLIRTFR